MDFPSGENVLLNILNSDSLSFEDGFDFWKWYNVFIVYICCFCLPRKLSPNFWLETEFLLLFILSLKALKEEILFKTSWEMAMFPSGY